MNVTVLNGYGRTYSKCFQNNLILPTLTPQTVIFGILDSASNDSIFKNNKVFINHIHVSIRPEKKVHKYK